MEKQPSKPTAGDVSVGAHYGLLLGIGSPWQVREVDLKLQQQRVEVEVGYESGALVVCPQCGQACQRQWRHLDLMQFATIIRARVPRCRCPEHGVLNVHVPWAQPHGRFTLMFEAFAVTVIAAARSYVQAMEISQGGLAHH